MPICPKCQSPNAASTKSYLTSATRIAEAVQSFGIRRLSTVAASGVQVLRNLTDWLRDYRCRDCGSHYDG